MLFNPDLIPNLDRRRPRAHNELSGMWDGQSLGTNGHATKWSDTTLIFEPVCVASITNEDALYACVC